MTVAELIAELSKFEASEEVTFADNEDGRTSIGRVSREHEVSYNILTKRYEATEDTFIVLNR